jgi:hypothetical protein
MKLNKEQHLLLNKLAKRVNDKINIWYNCKLDPYINDNWDCHICDKSFIFEKTLNEIWEHGNQHLKDSNLLPFI